MSIYIGTYILHKFLLLNLVDMPLDIGTPTWYTTLTRKQNKRQHREAATSLRLRRWSYHLHNGLSPHRTGSIPFFYPNDKGVVYPDRVAPIVLWINSPHRVGLKPARCFLFYKTE